MRSRVSVSAQRATRCAAGARALTSSPGPNVTLLRRQSAVRLAPWGKHQSRPCHRRSPSMVAVAAALLRLAAAAFRGSREVAPGVGASCVAASAASQGAAASQNAAASPAASAGSPCQVVGRGVAAASFVQVQVQEAAAACVGGAYSAVLLVCGRPAQPSGSWPSTQ